MAGAGSSKSMENLACSKIARTDSLSTNDAWPVSGETAIGRTVSSVGAKSFQASVALQAVTWRDSASTAKIRAAGRSCFTRTL